MRRFVNALRSTLGGGHDASLMGSLLLGLSIKGVSTVATFSIAVMLARTLGPTGYGTYVFALTLISLIALPLQSGLSNLVVREIAKLSLPRDTSLYAQLLTWARTRVLIILAAVLALGVALWVTLGQPPLTALSNRTSVIAIGVLLIVTIPFTAIQASAVRGLGFGNLGQVPDLVIRHCTFMALLACAALTLPAMSRQDGQIEPGISALSPMLAMGLHVLASTIAFCLAALFLRRVQTRTAQAGLANAPDHTNTANETGPDAWQVASWALLSVAGLQLLNSSIDVLTLGWLRGDTEVGLYRVLVQLSTLVAFGLMAINPVLHGRIARLYASKEMAAMQCMVTRGVLLCLVVAALPMFALFAYGTLILTWLFGPEYAAQGLALKIILCGQLANVAFGAVAALLNMTGHQSDTLRGMLIAVAFNLVLNLTLVPSYGIMGAAIATALSTALWKALLWHMVWKRLKIDSSILGAGWRSHFSTS